MIKNMRQLHDFVAKRDKYICSVCHKDFDHPMYKENGRNNYVGAHHIKTRGAHPELALDTDNCALICIHCHDLTHKGLIK